MAQPQIKNLYYITHIDNIPSILQNGILSHQELLDSQIVSTPIYDQEIVNLRQQRLISEDNNLWSYANLYFQPRNPMMYRVVKEGYIKYIAVISIKPQVLQEPGIVITDGNAAHSQTQFYSLNEGVKKIKQNHKKIQNEWWQDTDGSKRIIMSECLIPKQVKPTLIESIYVPNHEVLKKINLMLPQCNIPVIKESNLFFQPNKRIQVGQNISVIDGDMFFSTMHTLTISVNLQGVMGKGLASRARYQFPDVYVRYQDACKSKQVTVTTPYLYKRESSVDQELADLQTPLKTPNSVKWFLLFATKRHWRENSRIEDIEAGLSWIRNNAVEQGIKSLAIPALGCGLGKLEWSQVAPLMCRYLSDIGIDVAIYLPREQQLDPKFLTPEFLLNT
ncbi:DarT ssDNA thymidine ADP-ribosyltransferase family protein [Roseofilum sp. BLCC_M154]|uniref:DarT ssDNA thymidine ADP-ribosyltransferase family protein n=1 Tax=Roseofilum acuticapitatum BLCC-M154 TaxID=3022444 RepID=A0ABT7AZU6_9CYAN|nr:DarT ssDNA thymidine ADP-ribosyltransferase family protein [Roseofilum acuticapitatum]MDJ1171593.1 DarT ssDNA thymidine ADP-ribosyltransferase family protein [Roseofilum acuticapitatum BLCC-M154]